MSNKKLAAVSTDISVFNPENARRVLSAVLKASWIPLVFFAGQAFAQNEALTQAANVVRTSVILIIGVISAIAFVYVAYSLLTKFNDARRGRGEWGEVIVPFIAGAAILVLIAWLVEQATTASAAITVAG